MAIILPTNVQTRVIQIANTFNIAPKKIVVIVPPVSDGIYEYAVPSKCRDLDIPTEMQAHLYFYHSDTVLLNTGYNGVCLVDMSMGRLMEFFVGTADHALIAEYNEKSPHIANRTDIKFISALLDKEQLYINSPESVYPGTPTSYQIRLTDSDGKQYYRSVVMNTESTTLRYCAHYLEMHGITLDWITTRSLLKVLGTDNAKLNNHTVPDNDISGSLTSAPGLLSEPFEQLIKYYTRTYSDNGE